MESLFGWLIDVLRNIWDNLCSGLASFFDWLISFLTDFWEGLGEVIKAAWESLSTFAIEALSSLVSGVNSMIPDYRSLLPNWQGFGDYLTLVELFVPLRLAWALLLGFLSFCLLYYSFKLVFRVLT